MGRAKWAVVMAALCLVVAIVAMAYAAGQAKAVPVQEVVRARRFELVDDNGRVRAALQFTIGGWSKPGTEGKTKEEIEREEIPQLVLFDERGTKRADLNVDRHGSWFALSRETGKLGAMLEASLRNNGLAVFDLEQKRKITLVAGELWPEATYQHGIVLYDGEGKKTAVLVTDAEGKPQLSLFPPKGGTWSAP